MLTSKPKVTRNKSKNIGPKSLWNDFQNSMEIHFSKSKYTDTFMAQRAQYCVTFPLIHL